MQKSPLVLIILDGFGLAPTGPGNAISLARKPYFDYIWQNYPHSKLHASGLDVGLPIGQMGNSEVGHLNIGAGRVVKQLLVEIDDQISDGRFRQNQTMLDCFEEAKNNNGTLHLLGLVSDGGVHSHISHLIEIVRFARDYGLDRVHIHAITDGRDTAPESALDFIQELDLELIDLNFGDISTISGRYYAMDRDNRWERTEESFNNLTRLDSVVEASAEDVISKSYAIGTSDEFIKPVQINPNGLISKNDSVLCFNFRPDRMRQITTKLLELTSNVYTFSNYGSDLDTKIIFPKQILKRTLGEIIATNNLSQARIAETEKFPHVTYFMNGGEEQTFKNEIRNLIPSPKVATYDMQPEMSVEGVARSVIDNLVTATSDVIIVNFANCDMVGHTGDISATIKAVEAVDKALGSVLKSVSDAEGIAVITADHGNAEEMLDEHGQVATAHTTNPVPFIITTGGISLRDGSLSDIAPTILDILNIKKPAEMTGESLII